MDTERRGPFDCLVVLGESNVQGGGWLASGEERWADVLARLLETAQERPLRYVNAGVGASVISPRSPGYDASVKPSAAERLDAAVIAHRPDLLVIAYGLNDMRAGMAPEPFRAELEDLLHRVRAVVSPLVVLANPYYMTAYHYYPPFDRSDAAFHRRYNDMLREVAQARGCLYADIYSAMKCDHVVHQDTVHANKVGCMLIAHEVFRTIVHSAPGVADRVRHRDEATEWTQRTGADRARGVERSLASKAR